MINRISVSFFSFLTLLVLMSPIESSSAASSAMQEPSLEILMLSRGQGVPSTTRAAFNAIAAQLEQAKGEQVLSLRRQMIGIEGETKLCVVFKDAAALAALSDQINQLANGVELLQIREAPCE